MRKGSGDEEGEQAPCTPRCWTCLPAAPSLPRAPTSEHNPVPRAQHVQEPLPSPPGAPTAAAEPRSASISRRAAPRHPARAAVPTARGPSAPPPATAALTGLHGEEEEEEGGGTAPAAGGQGPGAGQPGHGVAGASAGCGARCAPGAYVGHAPAPPHRLVEIGTGRCHGNGFQPPASHPDPGPHPGVLRRGDVAAWHLPLAPPRRSPTRGRGPLCRGLCIQGTARWPPAPPGSWVFMPAAAHHHGIRAAGRNCLPFSQPLQPRGRPCALCGLPGPPPAPTPLGGLHHGAGAPQSPSAAAAGWGDAG